MLYTSSLTASIVSVGQDERMHRNSPSPNVNPLVEFVVQKQLPERSGHTLRGKLEAANSSLHSCAQPVVTTLVRTFSGVEFDELYTREGVQIKKTVIDRSNENILYHLVLSHSQFVNLCSGSSEPTYMDQHGGGRKIIKTKPRWFLFHPPPSTNNSIHPIPFPSNNSA